MASVGTSLLFFWVLGFFWGSLQGIGGFSGGLGDSGGFEDLGGLGLKVGLDGFGVFRFLGP